MSGNKAKLWSGCLGTRLTYGWMSGNEAKSRSGCLGMRLSHRVDVQEEG